MCIRLSGVQSCFFIFQIKRRADGTRYLARRPVRNKILKERAEKLSNERCGVSTDDDALSELKVHFLFFYPPNSITDLSLFCRSANTGPAKSGKSIWNAPRNESGAKKNYWGGKQSLFAKTPINPFCNCPIKKCCDAKGNSCSTNSLLSKNF